MTSSQHDRTRTRESDRHVDGLLGALYSLGNGTQRCVPLAELRQRLSDMSDEEFDKIVVSLDRDGAIVLDRGDDGTMVRIASTHLGAPNAPQSLVDRVIGAVWAVSCAMPYRIAPLAIVRQRVGDISQAQFERALAAALITGEIERTRGFEGPAVKLALGSMRRFQPMIQGMCGHDHVGMGMGVGMAQHLGMGMGRGLLERAEELRFMTREVAHRLWELRGRPQGGDLRDWLDAERMVRDNETGSLI
jgi:hypothetical protein